MPEGCLAWGGMWGLGPRRHHNPSAEQESGGWQSRSPVHVSLLGDEVKAAEAGLEENRGGC